MRKSLLVLVCLSFIFFTGKNIYLMQKGQDEQKSTVKSNAEIFNQAIENFCTRYKVEQQKDVFEVIPDDLVKLFSDHEFMAKIMPQELADAFKQVLEKALKDEIYLEVIDVFVKNEAFINKLEKKNCDDIVVFALLKNNVQIFEKLGVSNTFFAKKIEKFDAKRWGDFYQVSQKVQKLDQIKKLKAKIKKTEDPIEKKRLKELLEHFQKKETIQKVEKEVCCICQNDFSDRFMGKIDLCGTGHFAHMFCAKNFVTSEASKTVYTVDPVTHQRLTAPKLLACPLCRKELKEEDEEKILQRYNDWMEKSLLEQSKNKKLVKEIMLEYFNRGTFPLVLGLPETKKRFEQIAQIIIKDKTFKEMLSDRKFSVQFCTLYVIASTHGLGKILKKMRKNEAFKENLEGSKFGHIFEKVILNEWENIIEMILKNNDLKKELKGKRFNKAFLVICEKGWKKSAEIILKDSILKHELKEKSFGQACVEIAQKGWKDLVETIFYDEELRQGLECEWFVSLFSAMVEHGWKDFIVKIIKDKAFEEKLNSEDFIAEFGDVNWQEIDEFVDELIRIRQEVRKFQTE